MYKLIITKADFLEPKEFIKRYSTKDVKAIVEDVEFEGTEDVHTSGITERLIPKDNLEETLQDIYFKEFCQGESMGIYDVEDTELKNELMTEDDFDFWHV